MTDKVVVLVTCGSVREAKKIARALVAKRFAACVNVHSARVESVYRWKGKVKEAREILLFIKSSRRAFPKLRAEIEKLHSYDVPEIVALPIAAVSRAYGRWLDDCLARRK
ncbi:MAG: divalent-cation tolerance protein CutA [Candidatus Acidiferrales bacterium]